MTTDKVQAQKPEEDTPVKTRRKRRSLFRISRFRFYTYLLIILCLAYIIAQLMHGNSGFFMNRKSEQVNPAMTHYAKPTPISGVEVGFFQIEIRDVDIYVDSKRLTIQQAVQQAESSGKEVELVFYPSARVSAEEKLKNELARAGVKIGRRTFVSPEKKELENEHSDKAVK